MKLLMIGELQKVCCHLNTKHGLIQFMKQCVPIKDWLESISDIFE